jgi:uncharacterized membrane protein
MGISHLPTFNACLLDMTSTELRDELSGAAPVVEALVAGTLFSYAAGRDDRRGTAARAVAVGLLIAAWIPALGARLLRAGAARRRIHLRKVVVIERPVRDVFAFCRDFENFPRVIQSLHRITDFQDGRSRWEVVSPSGEILTWDAEVTKYVPNVVIAWRSISGSVVDCNGLIRFAPTPSGGTRLQIQIDYDPCTTGFTDALRALVDIPRERQLEADLSRANFYIKGQPSNSELLDADADADADDSSALSA